MLMRKSVLLLIWAMLVLTGCDFFRVVAGRPTGKEVEAMKTELLVRLKEDEARQEAMKLEQARKDSLERMEEKRVKDEKDSIDAVNYMAGNKVVLHKVSRLGGISSDQVPEGVGVLYRVIVGSYREEANAKAMAGRISEAGDFCPHLIYLRSGMIAVATCPTDRIARAVAGLKSLRTHAVCPADAWILKVE